MELRGSYRNWLFALAFLVLFVSTTSFRVRDYADKSLDLQTGFKLAGIAVTLLLPFSAVLAGRLKISTPLLLAWLAFLLSLVACSVNSPQISVSLTDSLAFLGCFLFCIWMAERFGETNTVALLIVSVGIISAISLVTYYVSPDLGRMHAWLGSEFGTNNRIKGIVGSPNGLGSMTSMSLIFAILYYKTMSQTARVLALISVPLALVCLIMSDNRMSMLTLVICVTIWLTAKGNKAANILLLGLAGSFVLLLFLSAPDVILSGLSRSGDVEEIATGTGRSQIWAVVLEMIGQKPVFGHGYASSTFILPTDPRLFSVAAHAHNMYLEILFSGGIISFVLFLTALVITLYQGIRFRCFEPLVILFFFLLRGMTEPTPFSGLPSIGGYVFFISVAFVALRSRIAQGAEQRAAQEEVAMRLTRYRDNLHKPSRAGSTAAGSS